MRQKHIIGLRNFAGDNFLYLLAIVLFCYVSFVLPLQIMGLPSGFDMATDIRFATSFQDAILSGHLFPSWANDNFGYGSVGIRFYPPLSLYLLAVTQLLTHDWFTTFVANLYLWLLIGCIGIYYFVRQWGTPVQGLLAAVLYATVPQHLNEIFQYFMFAEFAVWGVLPFCFLYVTKICRGGGRKDTLLFALSFSILILTHLPTTIIVSLCLPLYAAILIDWHDFRKISLHLLVGIAIALLATSFRTVMLVNEFSWLAHTGPEHYGSGYYDYRRWFFPNILEERSLYVFVVASWLFDIAIVLTVALIIPAVAAIFRKSEKTDPSLRKILIASLATALFTFFMLSRPSLYLWQNLVFLQRLQFPWRWLSVLSLSCVVLFSFSVPYLISEFKRYKRFVAYSALTLVIAILLFDVTQIIIPSGPVSKSDLSEEVNFALNTKPMWKGWWPIWAKEKAFASADRVDAGNRNVEILSWGRESKHFVIEEGETSNVRLALFYYPLWKASVNGHEVELGMDENGAMTIPISGETSNVSLNFEEPRVYAVANVVSTVAWLLPVFLIAAIYVRKYFASIRIKPLLDKEYEY